MMRYVSLGFLLVGLYGVQGAGAVDLQIATVPYTRSNLFTNPLLPVEGQTVTIGMEIPAAGVEAAEVAAAIDLRDGRGNTVLAERLSLTRNGEVFEGALRWTASSNGLYKVAVLLDPDNTIPEENEGNNAAELDLPVLVPGRALFFPWYAPSEWVRWANVYTSVGGDAASALRKRGIHALSWEYGGFSWSYFDDTRFDTEREAAMAELEELFFQKYTNGEAVPMGGIGIDEIGGYPDSAKHLRSIASSRALVRAKKAMPDRFFAVWYAGWTGDPLAALNREGADLLLLETYLWRAIPDELGGEDIYQIIRNKIDPVIRSHDMFVPVYGNACYTLMAFETSERPDRTDLGEQEQVVRYVRRICPEMRGIAFYNGGYGGYGIEPGEAADAQHEAVVRNADRLCFEYFIKPCVTFQQEALWVRQHEGVVELTVAVSNIGAMDSGPVSVRFLDGGEPIGEVTLDHVPAGSGRTANRAMARLSIMPVAGFHEFSACIVAAPGSTVLDGRIVSGRFISGPEQ